VINPDIVNDQTLKNSPPSFTVDIINPMKNPMAVPPAIQITINNKIFNNMI
jgi:hypothetical protein